MVDVLEIEAQGANDTQAPSHRAKKSDGIRPSNMMRGGGVRSRMDCVLAYYTLMFGWGE